MIDQKEDLNIKDLAFQESTIWPALPFIPERDVPDDAWNKWVEEINNSTQYSDVRDYIEITAYMAILFPDRTDDMTLPPLDAIIKDLGASSLTFLSDIRLLFPDQFESVREKFPLEFKDLKKLIEDKKTEFNTWEAFVLFPEKWDEIQAIPGIADFWKEQSEISKKHGNWVYFSRFKTLQKLLDPAGTVVSDDEWTGMHHFLQTGENAMTAEHAACMKMLSADEVKMTPEGLRFIMSKNETVIDQQPQTPERRKF